MTNCDCPIVEYWGPGSTEKVFHYEFCKHHDSFDCEACENMMITKLNH